MMPRALILASITAGAFLALGLLGAFGGAAVPAPAASGVHVANQAAPVGAPSGLGGMMINPPANCQLPSLVLQLQPPQVVLGQTSMLEAYLVNAPTFAHGGMPDCVGTVTFQFSGPMVPGGHVSSQSPMFALDSNTVGAGNFPTTVTAYLSHTSGVSSIVQTATLVVLP